MASKRKSLSKKTRFDVFKRDYFTCQYCGSKPPSVLLEVDHIVAVASGGENDTDNLITACEDCNRGKGARALSSVPQSIDSKARDIAEREEQLKGFHAVIEKKRNRLESETWRALECLYGRELTDIGQDDFNSARIFVERIGLHAVLDAAEIARGNKCRDLFKYFCGVCWSLVRQAEGS